MPLIISGCFRYAYLRKSCGHISTRATSKLSRKMEFSDKAGGAPRIDPYVLLVLNPESTPFLRANAKMPEWDIHDGDMLIVDSAADATGGKSHSRDRWGYRAHVRCETRWARYPLRRGKGDGDNWPRACLSARRPDVDLEGDVGA